MHPKKGPMNQIVRILLYYLMEWELIKNLIYEILEYIHKIIAQMSHDR